MPPGPVRASLGVPQSVGKAVSSISMNMQIHTRFVNVIQRVRSPQMMGIAGVSSRIRLPFDPREVLRHHHPRGQRAC